jgi:DNA-directed RNA polymerase beta' subunit
MVKVKTHFGRTVTATKGLSFLTRKNNKLVSTPGSDIKVGDLLPVVKNIPKPEDCLQALDLSLYLLKDSFIHTIEMEDVIPINLKGTEEVYHVNELKKLLGCDEQTDEIIKQSLDQDVFYDYVDSVEEVDASTKWVYDVTIAETRNFTTFGGLALADTFHQAGNSAKDVTLGVPRLKEVLGATKKPPRTSCTIYVKDEILDELKKERADAVDEAVRVDAEKKSMQRIAEIAAPLASLNIGYFLASWELQYLDIDPKDLPKAITPIPLITYERYEPKWWVTVHEKLFGPPKFTPDAWVILLKFDMDKMYTFGITTDQLADAITGELSNCVCIPSPNNLAQIEVYVNISETSENYQKRSSDRSLVTDENKNYFLVRDVTMDFIKKIKVQGIQNITKTYIRKEGEEWMIDTQGTNLMELLGIDGVDTTRTSSDNMWEIYKVLGIEATRKFLIKEITRLLSFDGTYINQRHISLLVDAMTISGTITGANRYGISRDVGPIAKGLFEKAVDNFAEAALFAETDTMNGFAASVMFGTVAKIGTGTVVVKDAEKLPATPRQPINVPIKPKKR